MGVSVKKSEENRSSSGSKGSTFVKKETAAENVSVKYDKCYNCSDKVVTRMRCFSEQAWTVLLLWNEISPSTVEKPICDYCYNELRAILIDRMDEVDQAVESKKEKSLTTKYG